MTLSEGTGELQVPQLRACQPLVQQVAHPVEVAHEEADDEAGHREVVAVPKQRLDDVRQGQLQRVDEVIGESLDRKQSTHARIRTDRGTAVPAPDVRIAYAPPYADARKFEI